VVPRTDRGRRVQQRIYADRPQCVSVVGDPRIGKSAFLDWLAGAAEANDPAPPPGSRFVRLGLAGPPANASPSTFLRAVLDALESAPPAGDDGGGGRISTFPGSVDPSPRTYATLENVVQDIAKTGGRLLLLLDDFDHVTSSPAFPPTFFSFLRSLANNFPVAYVTTSRLDLQQLCVSKEVEESPFFNIFQNLTLGPLDDALTRALAAERAPGVDARALGDWALAESGGLPAVTVACAELAAAGHVPGAPDAVHALDEAVAGDCGELWEHFEPPHRALLQRLAAGEAPGERDARPLRDLGPRRGYLREQDGKWTIVSRALGRFLAARKGEGGAPGLLGRMKRLFGGSR
jgi:eukaryotic-like serine/threonine-protein kinase